MIAYGAGDRTIYDHAGDVEYIFNSAKTTLHLPRNSGHDRIIGFDPQTHFIVKNCVAPWTSRQVGNDKVVYFWADTLTFVNTTAPISDNIRCEAMAENIGECQGISEYEDTGEYGTIDALDDFCFPEQVFYSAVNIGIGFGYGFAVVSLQAFLALILHKMKVSLWGILVASEVLMALILLARTELSLLLVFSLALRPILTMMKFSNETINAVEIPLSHSLIHVDAYSTLAKVNNNLLSCGACMFGTWTGQKLFNRAVKVSDELESTNKLKIA